MLLSSFAPGDLRRSLNRRGSAASPLVRLQGLLMRGRQAVEFFRAQAAMRFVLLFLFKKNSLCKSFVCLTGSDMCHFSLWPY